MEVDTLELAMLTDSLSEYGYGVMKALDGMEEFNAVIAEKPYVIITDKVMRYGFSMPRRGYLRPCPSRCS